MIKTQIRQATKGMPRDQRKAYRKQQIQQVKVMNDQQKVQWRQNLQAQWNALPNAQKSRIEQRWAAHEARHQGKGGGVLWASGIRNLKSISLVQGVNVNYEERKKSEGTKIK